MIDLRRILVAARLKRRDARWRKRPLEMTFIVTTPQSSSLKSAPRHYSAKKTPGFLPKSQRKRIRRDWSGRVGNPQCSRPGTGLPNLWPSPAIYPALAMFNFRFARHATEVQSFVVLEPMPLQIFDPQLNICILPGALELPLDPHHLVGLALRAKAFSQSE